MSRMTIDYGIDLGTTNSSIALVSGTGTEVIKNGLDADITPSAVYINGRGNLWVGQNAKSKETDERSEDDVFLEFKRRMGTSHKYSFRSSGRGMMPEDLSAEVLKSLRGDVFLRKGEEISSTVITVPAAFELHQCEATKRAGLLAGFNHVALLQEPTAAALAYGYQKLDAKAYWLVFDFGGGTFDAALIRSEDGSMVVANHGGDNFLGGSDIDWTIVERLLVPRVAKEYGIPEFRRGTAAFNYDMLRLKGAAEAAKIELSLKGSTILEATLRKVRGETVTFETEITREEVARVAEPIVARAIGIATRVLNEKRVSPAAVSKLIFVGGTCLAPYIRDIVQERLRITADIGVDPMTVVARGAAIFAGTQRLLRLERKQTRSICLPVELLYKPVGVDTDPLVGGKVGLAPGAQAASYTVELINQQTKWRSGRSALTENAAFQFSVRAEPGQQNTFLIELRDATGTLCPIEPDRFAYTVGMVVEEQPIINHLGVAMADNSMSLHFTKGQGLPAKCTKTYRSATGLRRGESSQLLRIPIVEGNRELADRNVLIGTLEITANSISRDLPLGSEIEVTLSMDTSRMLTVLAYVPMLDEEFPAKITLGGEVRQPRLPLLQEEWRREAERLSSLRARVVAASDMPSLAAVRDFEGSELVAELDLRLSGEGADFDALLKADRDLLDFKIRLDTLAASIAFPLLIVETDNMCGFLDSLAARHGTPEELARAGSLRREAGQLVSEKNEERLRAKYAEIHESYCTILHRQDSFWREYFEELARDTTGVVGKVPASTLVAQGRELIAAGNFSELRNVVYQLQELLPKKVAEVVYRGYGSTLIA